MRSQPISSSPFEVVTPRRVVHLLTVMSIACIPVLVGRDAVKSTAALWQLADSPNPYFVSAQATLLYIGSPLVVASACLLLLSPGLLLALALDSAKSVGEWVVNGLALSIIVLSGMTQIVQAIAGSPIRENAFVAVAIGCSLLCFGCLCARMASAKQICWPLGSPHALSTLIAMTVVPLLLLVALTPKFYWENFNGDGAHAFESARLLLVQPVPFWPATAGDISSFPDVTSLLFTYPTSWFIRLFGEVEASARLPFLLYLVGLYAVIVTLIDYGRNLAMSRVQRWLLWLALATYAVVMAYSATYNPYAADIALPATQDTLAMVLYLGYILNFVGRRYGWMCLFAVLTFLCLPNSLLLIGLWLLAALLWKPRPWTAVKFTAGAIVACIVGAAIMPLLLRTLHLPEPGNEYGVVNLLKRFAFLQFTDWQRLFFVIVPGGILPALALLVWRWQDQLGRILTLVSVTYFIFFYIQAHVVLHYFVPVMLLPLVVFWRSEAVTNAGRRYVVDGLVAACGLLGLLLSLPNTWSIDTSARVVGMTIDERIGGYESSNPAVFHASELLNNLFPYDWEPAVPNKSYGGSPLSWVYYARHGGGTQPAVNYVLQLANQPSPADMHLVASEGAAALYMRSEAVWTSQRSLRPPTPAGSSVYQLSRGTLFRAVSLVAGSSEINVVDLIESYGFDLEPLLTRLNIQR